MVKVLSKDIHPSNLRFNIYILQQNAKQYPNMYNIFPPTFLRMKYLVRNRLDDGSPPLLRIQSENRCTEIVLY